MFRKNNKGYLLYNHQDIVIFLTGFYLLLNTKTCLKHFIYVKTMLLLEFICIL
ncbi:hypothetical protein NUSPORA_01330 [Nucleospora cyclopteri]